MPSIQTLGRIHALASHAWCFHRGNAALAHMLVRVLADSAKFSLGKVIPGRDPNIDALVSQMSCYMDGSFQAIFFLCPTAARFLRIGL